MGLWNNISGKLTGNSTGRRNRLAILLSLLLAFSIWFVSNMVLKYSEIITVPITVISNLDGYAQNSSNTVDVLADCELSGFGIIHARVFARHNSKKVELPKDLIHQKSDEEFYVISRELQQYSRFIFGDEVNVRYFISDTLSLHFDRVGSKKVPVYLDASIEYTPQYTQVGEYEVIPDSVIVYADPALLAVTDRLYTSKVRQYGVSSDVSGMCKVKHTRNLRLSESEVRYRIEVSRYVEIKETFAVKTRGVPDDMSLFVIPTNVDVTFKCIFPLNCYPEADCNFYVDWNDYVESRSGKCPLKWDTMPSGVISFTSSEDIFDCIAGENR